MAKPPRPRSAKGRPQRQRRELRDWTDPENPALHYTELPRKEFERFAKWCRSRGEDPGVAIVRLIEEDMRRTDPILYAKSVTENPIRMTEEVRIVLVDDDAIVRLHEEE